MYNTGRGEVSHLLDLGQLNVPLEGFNLSLERVLYGDHTKLLCDPSDTFLQ